MNSTAHTAALLDRRTRGYRNLVVVVALIGLAAPVVALVAWDWRPLLGWLLIVPAAGGGLLLDARAVIRWRGELLDAWAAGRADLDALRDTLGSIRSLPARTITGMLDPLPTRRRLGTPADPPLPLRRLLADTVQHIDSTSLWGMAVGLVGLTMVAASCATAAVAGSLWPLVGVPVGLMLGWFARRVGSRPSTKWLRGLTAALQQGDGQAPAFVELAGRLAWDGLPAGGRRRWLAAVRSEPQA
jgi:hypothetical protein